MNDTRPAGNDPPQSPLDLVRKAAALAASRISQRDEVIRKEQELRDADMRLLRELADLLQQHGELPMAPCSASNADVILGAEDGSTMVVRAKRSNASDGSDGPGNTRETVLRLLAEAGRPMETSEIIAGVKQAGVDSQPATVRSLISKMTDSGQIEKLRRGLYRLGSSVAQGSGSAVWLVGTHQGSARVQGHYRLDEPTGRIYTTSIVENPTLDDFFTQSTDEDDVPEPSDADYSEMSRDAEQAYLENQADQEVTDPLPGSGAFLRSAADYIGPQVAEKEDAQ